MKTKDLKKLINIVSAFVISISGSLYPCNSLFVFCEGTIKTLP
jgi:hypothetical protein